MWGLASGVGGCLILLGPPAGSAVLSADHVLGASHIHTEGLSSPHPSLGAPAVHRNSAQATEWAVIGRQARLPLLLQVQCGCPWPGGRARHWLSLTSLGGWGPL